MDDPKKLAERFKPKPVKVINPDRQLAMVRFSPCGKLLAGACQDGSIRRWDAESLTELPALKDHGGWLSAIGFAPDSQRLFSVDTWGGLRAWPAHEQDGKPVWSAPNAHDGWVRGLALRPDGQTLATCGRDQLVRLWSAAEGKKLQELAGHAEDVFTVAFHPDGKSVVSGDLTGVLKVWDATSGKLVRELDAKSFYLVSRLQDVGGLRCLSFDAAGATLFCAGTKPSNGGSIQGVPQLLIFDWAKGEATATLKFGGDADGFICDVGQHPAGFLMLATSGNPGTGKLIFQRPQDKDPFFQQSIPNCHSLTLHPNGKRLVVSATNAGSNGNGRNVGKGKEYPGNFSPLHVFDVG